MSDFIDDVILKAAWDALYRKEGMIDLRAALEAALPMIGEKLAKEMPSKVIGKSREAVAWNNSRHELIARIRELTGAKP
jgi:DNA primase